MSGMSDTFHGTHIQGPDYVKIAEACGAFGLRVDDPDALEDTLRAGLKAVNGGQAAVLDVVLG